MQKGLMENLNLEISSFFLYYGVFSFNLTIIALCYLVYNKIRYDSFFFSLRDVQYENLLENNKTLLSQIKSKDSEIAEIQKDANELSKIIINKLRGD